MVPFPLYLALKYLRPKRTFVSAVTVISVVGVLLGVAILVIVLSVMTGFDEMWRDKILSFKPHLTVIGKSGVIEDDEAVCRIIERLPGIKGVSPSIETRVLIQHAGRTAAPVVVGVDPVRAAGVSRIPTNICAGSFDLDGDKLVVGRDLAAQLWLRTEELALVYSPMSVTSTNEMYLPEELTVSGVFNLGMHDFDAGFALTSIEVARQLVGIEKGAQAIYVMTDDPFKFERYSEAIRTALGPEYIVRTWKEVDSILFDALRHEKGLMAVLLGIITVVAIFCVTNTLIVITYQKTKEIGLLKALGFSSWKIMGAFIWHGWIQCMIGILLGIVTGLVILHNLSAMTTFLSRININAFPKEIYGLSEIPWRASASDITFISVFVMVFCTLSSLIPACRAVWLDPVEALRSE